MFHFVLLSLSLLELGGNSTPAAYLDPGTGSIIFQALVGAALASLLTIKLFWYRLKTFFANTIMRRDSERPDDDRE